MAPVTSRSVAILGSTGSIGTQALEVIAAHPGAFTVAALTAGGNVELLARQAVEFDVPLVGVARGQVEDCLLYTSPSPRDRTRSRMPSSA